MRRSAAPVAAGCLALVARASVAAAQGALTTWRSANATPMDTHGPCEFVRDMHGSVGQDPPAYANGAACGACYMVRPTSDEGAHGDSTGHGAASEAIVTVSTGGTKGAGRFDCFPGSFEAITGGITGEFDVEFEEGVCDAIWTTPSVTSFEAKNQYCCKMVFNSVGKWGALSTVYVVAGAEPHVGEQCDREQHHEGDEYDRDQQQHYA
ncbi:unnamed protein product [Prorocentrum cordatum]|uniref:Expansin-like EG45 domain-containing protein n=1 Tax=Prorocentrum cordatum TaxID=2364126 RepID=A0ABN9RXS8_9DINO|nr:unnamed protein product [Polarella glacialis]